MSAQTLEADCTARVRLFWRAEEGDVRLVAEVAVNGFATGAVQLFRGGRYGAVCAAGFSAADAAVVCRQLGLQGPAFVLPDPFGVADAELPRDADPGAADLQVRIHKLHVITLRPEL